jgi:hypothetical protein
VFAEVIAMMGFAARRRSVAARPDAAAVANGQGNPLPCRVEPELPTHVERIAVPVDGHVHRAVSAEVAVDGRARQDSTVLLSMTDREEAAQRVSRTDGVFDDDHPHPRLTHAEYVWRLSESAGAEDIDEQVVRELLVGSRICDQLLGLSTLLVGDEAGPSASGAQGGVEHRLHPQPHLVVERDVPAALPVGVDPHPIRATLKPLREPLFGPDRIEKVADDPRPLRQLFGSQRARLVDEVERGEGPRLAHGSRRMVGKMFSVVAAWFAETSSNGVELSGREASVQ